MKALLNQVELANSESVQRVEGNHYFPSDSVNWEYLTKNDNLYHCPWKGDCTFYDISVGGDTHESAAWSYENPKAAAQHIRSHVAFAAPVEVD